MKRVLKDHFIPHQGNDYQPFFLRFKITLALLLMVLLLEGTYLLSTIVILPRSENFAAIFASVLVDQTNRERSTSEQLGQLRHNPKLELAAKLKAEDMASKGYFSHNTPDGKTPWYWFKQAGYEYAAAGENLAVNFTDSKDVTEAWMRSPTHRANIMSGNYTEIGIATAEGMYKGRSAIFVVQEFGRPSIVARQIEPATSTASALSNMISGSVAGAAVVTPKQKDTIVPAKVSLSAQQTKDTKKTIAIASQQVASEEKTAPTMLVPTTTVVAGEDTKILDIPTESFAETLAPEPSSVLEKSSKLETMIASPRQTTTTLFLILAAIVSFAVGLAIFIKIRVQHPHIIANGVLLLAIILTMVILNAALGFTRGAI